MIYCLQLKSLECRKFGIKKLGLNFLIKLNKCVFWRYDIVTILFYLYAIGFCKGSWLTC